MSMILQVMLNGNPVYEYPRQTRLPGRQREFLDKMDHDMGQGIQLDTRFITQPTAAQRVHYVAMNLAQALLDRNDGLLEACCAYLVSRDAELLGIRIEQGADDVDLELVYTEY